MIDLERLTEIMNDSANIKEVAEKIFNTSFDNESAAYDRLAEAGLDDWVFDMRKCDICGAIEHDQYMVLDEFNDYIKCPNCADLE